MAKALRDGKGYTEQEIVIERPDGSRWIALANANPFYDESGRIAGAVNVLVDVTGRNRAEQALAQLAAIVESSEDAIFTKDLDGVITSWNRGAQGVYGYAAEEVVGRHVSLLIPADHQDELPAIMERLKQGERIEHYETVRLHKDGQRIDVSVSISPLRDGKGGIIGAAAIARDVSARKRAEEELREADRRKSEFLAMLAHELRNPLAPLRNGLQILRLAGDNGVVAAEARTMMERQLENVVRLIDDLLDLSRITSGRIELRKEQIDLATVVQSAVETSRPLIEAAGHELTVTLPPKPVVVYADRIRLAQVFANLLNNSAKYTERGGRIGLTVERQGSDVLVTVKDTGMGIAADMLERIFDMFTQVDRSLDRSQGGLGIGLSLVRRLVEMHGGRVEASSEGPGKGSEFTVRLSAVLSPGQGPGRVDGDDGHRSPKYRILVVDDNKDSANSLATLLKLRGHDARTAHDGLEAVEMAKKFRPDVVLLDVGMPKLNGYDACRSIRAQPWGAGMVLIALTGWGREADRSRSKEAGFNFHLVKPVDLADLEKLLAGLVLTPA
jgi:two-component system, chemotaxis family, CheB/CheR fusion protein